LVVNRFLTPLIGIRNRYQFVFDIPDLPVVASVAGLLSIEFWLPMTLAKSVIFLLNWRAGVIT